MLSITIHQRLLQYQKCCICSPIKTKLTSQVRHKERKRISVSFILFFIADQKSVLILVLCLPKSFFHIHEIFFKAHTMSQVTKSIMKRKKIMQQSIAVFKIPKLFFSAVANFLNISGLWVEMEFTNQDKSSLLTGSQLSCLVLFPFFPGFMLTPIALIYFSSFKQPSFKPVALKVEG